MSYVRQEKEYVTIGALTIHDFIEHNEITKSRFQILVDAASKIGDTANPQSRNYWRKRVSC